MNFDLNLPCCPVCKCEVRVVTRTYPGDESAPCSKFNHFESISFQCKAGYSRTASGDRYNPEMVKGPWSEWKLDTKCSRAHEVALKLLAEQQAKVPAPRAPQAEETGF